MWRVSKRPLGQPTRGKTTTDRLRRLDAFLATEETALLRRPGEAPFVDVGFGERPITTIEAAARFRKANAALRVVGVEIDRDRVESAKAMAVADIDFVHGGFELLGPPARLVRAMNVLRQYEEKDVDAAWRAMGRGLQEGGLLVEGTSDPLGRLLVVHRLRRRDNTLVSEGVLFLARTQALQDVRDFQAVLPKSLIHRMVEGEPVHGLFEDWSAAWRHEGAVPDPGERFRAAGRQLAANRTDVSAPARWLRRGALLWRLAFTLSLAACGPPDAPGGDPEIRLLYPTADTELRAIETDVGCTATFFVAVDLLNLEFVAPHDDHGSESVEGQGHYHIALDGDYYGAPTSLATEVAISSEDAKGWGACPGNTLELRVSLAKNDHEDLDGDDDPFPNWEQIVTVVFAED
jgi:hypothetical protein